MLYFDDENKDKIFTGLPWLCLNFCIICEKVTKGQIVTKGLSLGDWWIFESWKEKFGNQNIWYLKTLHHLDSIRIRFSQKNTNDTLEFSFHRNGILLRKLFWPMWEKIVLVIEKNFWNSRLKAENLQNFWDH